jgi:hypothetical protein
MSFPTNIYNVSLPRFVTLLLPLSLRKTAMVSWLFALITPYKELLAWFKIFRRDSSYKILHTPQVYSMENVLNDGFDPSLRRIYIVDGLYKSAVYFYEPDENSPVHFFEINPQVYFYEPEELEKLDVDFVVVLPLGMNLPASEMIRLKSLVDFYRLPDKTYTVRYA